MTQGESDVKPIAGLAAFYLPPQQHLFELGGYLSEPAGGATFPMLTSANRVGQFASVIDLNPGDNVAFVADYATTSAGTPADGGSYNRSRMVTLPELAGTFYLFVVTDAVRRHGCRRVYRRRF